jgi:hypothetical protein
VDAGVPAGLGYDATVVPLAEDRALLISSSYGADDLEHQTADLWDPAEGSWQPVEPLNKPRTRFAAVQLVDGRALVAGGLNDVDQSYSSAYVFDGAQPSAGWTKVGLMATARTGPSAAVLPDGRVLVAGGYFHTGSEEGLQRTPGVTLAAYRAPAPGGTPPGPDRNDVDIPPYGYALATAELFDPVSGTWSSTGPMTFARVGAPAVTLRDGRVLIVGSSGDYSVTRLDGRAFSTAEIFDPKTGQFTMAGDLPDIDRDAIAALGVELPEFDPAHGAAGTLAALDDGGAVLIGRNDWWKHEGDITRGFRFRVDDLTWTELGPPCAAAGYQAETGPTTTPGPCRFGQAVARLPDGRVLSAGPMPAVEGPWDANGAAAYDPATNGWEDLPAIPAMHRAASAVVLGDGSVLVVGIAGGEDVEVPTAIRFVPGG